MPIISESVCVKISCFDFCLLNVKLIRKDLCVKLWKCDRLNGSGQIMHSGKNVDLHVKFPTLEEVAGHDGMG